MTCLVCTRRTQATTTLCGQCLTQLVTALHSIAELWEELDNVRCRQTKYSRGRVGGRSAHKPLPWVDVTEQESIVSDTLTSWVDEAERCGLPAMPAPIRGPLQVHQAIWLAAQDRWARQYEEAFMLYDEAQHIAQLLAAAVDRPADARYVGPCHTQLEGEPCDAELYARPGAAAVICPACDTFHDVATRHEQLLEAAQDRLETAAVCARAVTIWGEPVRADRIRKWKQRGRISVKAHDGAGSPLYRLGDVIDLVREDVVKEGQRSTA